MSQTKQALYRWLNTDEVDTRVLTRLQEIGELTPEKLDELEAAGANDSIAIDDWQTFAREYDPYELGGERENYGEEDDKEFPYVG